MKAAFIGRFQPLHLGHQKAIEENRAKYDKICIVIANPEERTEKNPLTAEERKKIIKQCYPNIEIQKLEDNQSDKVWAEKLKEKTSADVVITQNDWTREAVEENTDITVKRQEMFQPDIYNATEVRRRIRSNEEWRYLTPKCARDTIEKYADKIRETGPSYEFKPGWKKENIQN
ncbi:MAG: adenylyltransferase/cytidyltransferase family protein [Candidatus Nanohaloarchaea archaeon]